MRLYSFLFLLAVLYFAPACNTVQKAVNNGNYDLAVERAARKLKRDPDKIKYAALLEKAFAKAYERDMQRVDYLKREGNPANNSDVYCALLAVRNRYRTVQPLLPMTIGNHQAVFQNVSDADLIGAKESAANYLYAHAAKLLETKNNVDARRAYDELSQVQSLYPDFRDVDSKMKEAVELGTNYVLFKTVNATPVFLPPDFERELLSVQVSDLNGAWVRYHTRAEESRDYAYNVETRVATIFVNPGDIQRISHVESKQVEDGFEYVLDDKGNVKKDSSGNDIKRKKYVVVNCRVDETRMRKVATIAGFVDYRRFNGEGLLKSVPFGTDVVYEYAYASAAGDVRALSPETLAKVNAPPGVFPPDVQMLADAGGKLKPIVRQILYDNRALLEQ